jgi:hypothetical protein
MTSHSTMPDQPQPATETAVHLFDNWFDPIEAVLRDRAVEDELEDELPQNSSGSDAPKAQKVPILSGFLAGGAEGGRTPDPLHCERGVRRY